MLYTQQAVQAGLRVVDGKRVFYLPKGDQLTSGARDWLAGERIEIIPHAQPKPERYETMFGAVLEEKPEGMTHLKGNLLVFKDHPRIVFRGAIDTLEAEILLCQLHCPHLEGALQEVLDFVRRLIRCDVLSEPVGRISFGGMDEQALRQRSHQPQKYYGQPHFMPSAKDKPSILHLNRLRTQIRQAELAAFRAFGETEQRDIVEALNRLSSYIWIKMIEEKGAKG